MRTSTRCTRAVDKWRTRFASSVKIFLTLFFVSVLGTNSMAQVTGTGSFSGVDFAQSSNENPTLGNVVWIGSILNANN